VSILFDRLRASGCIDHWTGLDAIVPVVIDNVSRYWYEHWTKESKRVEFWKDFPNVAPPFTHMFCEYQIPKEGSGGKYLRVGVLVLSVDLDLEDLGARTPHDEAETVRAKEHGVKWLIDCFMFVEFEKYDVVPTRTVFSWGIKGDGAIGHRSDDSNQPYVTYHEPGDVYEGRKSIEDIFGFADGTNEKGKITDLNSLMWPVFLAISFMHCKNVKVSEVLPEPKLSKKFAKNHDCSLVKYRIINIDPMQTILNKEGRANELGLGQALHICRGHFKTFGGEHKKLFGKLEGSYFWPQTLRGNPEYGTIKSTYKVNPPSEEVERVPDV